MGDVADAGLSDGDGSSGGSGGEDTSAWDGATLVVESPVSASFLPLGEDADFQATVYDAEGVATDFDEIDWSSDVDGSWAPVGHVFEDDSLGAGTHALTATAVLPNGNRLAYTVGGVLVQSAYAGVYSGTLTMAVAIEYDGTAYEFGCSGAATLVIDAEGEAATGGANCLLSLMGYELDTVYDFALENDDGDLSGSTGLDLTYYTLDLDTQGEVDEDGSLAGEFSGDFAGYGDANGEFTATRITRDVSAYQD
jgi:hypothetical protein